MDATCSSFSVFTFKYSHDFSMKYIYLLLLHHVWNIDFRNIDATSIKIDYHYNAIYHRVVLTRIAKFQGYLVIDVIFFRLISNFFHNNFIIALFHSCNFLNDH